LISPIFAIIAVVSLLMGACGDDDDSAGGAATFVGKVAGTQLSIAAVVEKDRALVYICDGHSGRRIDATLKDGAWQGDVAGLGELSVKASGGSVTGNIQAGGASYPFTAQRATGKGALLWATGDRSGTAIAAGWIVAADGTETGGVVRGITDGISNTIRLQPGSGSFIEQDNIIAILIGVRSPIRVPAP
jgi:hypothetical protein